MLDIFHLPCKTWRLLSSIIITILMGSLIASITSRNAFAFDIPLPIYPVNDAITTPATDPPLGIPSFIWSAVTGAVTYRLQVDSEINFNQPIILDISTQNTSFTPQSINNLFSDGELYWRVRVEDPTPAGVWSPIVHFTKFWATPENKSDLLSPGDGESLAFFDDPTFSWTPVIGAAYYRFQIATTRDDFASPLSSADTLSTSYQPNNQLINGIYYWRVVPVDIKDHLGTPSSVRSFTAAYGTQLMNMVPKLLLPEDESYPTFTPTFHWIAIEGTEYYRLEYTPDETCDFALGTSLVTRQTYYTSTDTFTNDARFCWHVRAESGPAVGDWSQTWHFQKRWDLKPVLLTPTHLYQTGLYPLYSWTPVPGASRYLIQISQDSSFNPIYEESVTSNTTYAPQNKYEGTTHYWWRVWPIDGGGEYGVVSDVSEFQSMYNSKAPILIYPLYYYIPNNYIGYTLNPYEDRTVALPIFIWHRIMVPAPVGGVFATAYRIQVDDSPYFSSPEWEYDTENNSATPTSGDDFHPLIGQDYYWRVCPLDDMNGECLVNPTTSLIWWSQIWKAHFDTNLELPPTFGDAPELLRPEYGQESVEATPLLEWWPLQSASQYQVEISRDASFSTLEISETVNIPAYSPNYSLVQRSLGRTDYGTFYWRVRALMVDGWSNWSNTWRYQIASQSEWRYSRTLGNPDNQLLIGEDPISDSPQIYDLTNFYASQSNTHWFFGFNANISTTDMTYVFYIDLDNTDGSGATLPPERDYHVTTNPEHQPEYAIYVDVISGVIDTQNTWIFAWNGNSWGFGKSFADADGSLYSTPGYIEIQVPNDAIGMSQDTSSASVILFSVNISNGDLQDSVPSDPGIPGNAILSRFSSISERMNLIYPPSTATGDPTSLTSILPFYWDWPTGSNGSTPFAGSILQVDLDQDYTLPHEANIQSNSNTSYLSENTSALLNDIVGDNIYYWRVQPRFKLQGHPEVYGAWSGGWSFRRLGFRPQGLYTSTISSTLTFGWDMSEGADSYHLQVASDPNFGYTIVDIITPMNSYTPPETISQGDYFWRVQIIRYGNVVNDWTQGDPFEFNLPTPEGLIPNNGDTLFYTPTYCWDPLLPAWKYHLQVSRDPDFSNVYDSIDTNNHCWTPKSGYVDGTYYWHVAMIDGNGWIGSYSPSATFTKQYPITTPISPINGFILQTPTFIWTPVDGASTYIFELSLDPSFSSLYDALETINTQYTPTSVYQDGKVYYWRVAFHDRNGNQGPYTYASIRIRARNCIFFPLINR